MELLPNVPMKDTPLASLIQQVIDALRKPRLSRIRLASSFPASSKNWAKDLAKELQGVGLKG
jgi:hypothetical protein